MSTAEKRTRSTIEPSFPAIAETVPGYYNTGWWGLIAPPGLPKTITERLNAIMNKALQSPEVAQRFYAMGNEAATSTPQGSPILSAAICKPGAS